MRLSFVHDGTSRALAGRDALGYSPEKQKRGGLPGIFEVSAADHCPEFIAAYGT
jgi:hypothetical protein